MMQVPIPQVDPLPLPGPAGLFKFLLLLVFTLHLLAMNCALAGGAAAVFSAVRGRSALHPFSRRLAGELSRMLPVFLAFAISLGVAVLLFVQVLYGNLLYASSILIGVFWISVIGLVIVAYYGLYYFEVRPGQKRGIIVAAGSVLCLLAVAFIFANNMSLALTPARWLAMYRAHPDGLSLNLAELSLPPRYLHMLVGATAVFAAVLCHIGCHRLRTDREYGAWLVRRCSQVFGAATAFQIMVGLWFLLALPRSIALYLLSNGAAATVFGAALLCALGAMFLILVGGHTSRPAPFVHSGFALTVVTVALMVVLRQMLRTAYIHNYARPESLPASPQTAIIVVFFLLFVLGLGTVGYMLRLLARASKASG
jgi:heme exporter protein D